MAIDAGNTNIVFALHDGDKVLHSWRCMTEAGRTADEYASWLYPLFATEGLDFGVIDAAIISSVVPDANFNLRRLCEKNFNAAVSMVNHVLVGEGLQIKINKPEELGADRIVNALAVKNCYRYPAIVVDFGTATTFDIVDESGAYCGGIIAPGINLSVAALHQAAAKLPKIAIKKPSRVVGGDTVEAMHSGVYWGYVSMIEGIVKRVSEEMNMKPFVLATGGLAGLIAQGTAIIEAVDGDLTLKGLMLIHKQQAKKRAA
ncbi:MAG: type III pantothenate kinase [Micavibrio sp.]